MELRFLFAKNINNSGQDGIIDVVEKRVICICDMYDAKFIANALEYYVDNQERHFDKSKPLN